MELREGRGGEGRGGEGKLITLLFFWIPKWECKLIFSCLFNGW